MDDPRTIRDRERDLFESLDRAQPGRATRLTTMVGRVYNAGAMPSTAMSYYAVHPVLLGGPETEGGALSETPLTNAQELVLVLGPSVPAVNDDLVCYEVGDRWVAERGGPKTTKKGRCPNCPDDFPDTLYYSDSYNSQPFGNGARTLVWDGQSLWTGLASALVYQQTWLDSIDESGNTICVANMLPVGETWVIYKLSCPSAQGVWQLQQFIPVCSASGQYPYGGSLNSPNFQYRSISATGVSPCGHPVNLSFPFSDPIFCVPTVAISQ
jgi:hypothetical protein